jgi:two-component system response regulator FixJ
MKAGALDFIEKPIEEDRLLTAIKAALFEGARKTRDDEAVEAARRMATLSPRERQVLERIVSGRPNKLIAYDLNISVRTVEVHRTRLMVRLGTSRAPLRENLSGTTSISTGARAAPR